MEKEEERWWGEGGLGTWALWELCVAHLPRGTMVSVCRVGLALQIEQANLILRKNTEYQGFQLRVIPQLKSPS